MDAVRPIKEIEDELVAIATNNTIPASLNDWDLDLALRVHERRMVQEQGDYLGFAHLCQACGQRVRGTNATEALFALGAINGHRRTPAYHLLGMDSLLESVVTMTNRLDDADPRKLRLRILHPYHAAIHAENQGDYKRAAEMLTQSALAAAEAGDKIGAAIAKFRSKQAAIYAALATGDDTSFLIEEFGYNALTELEADLSGTKSAHGVWDLFNGPVAVVIAHFLCERNISKKTLNQAHGSLRKIHVDQIDVALAQAGGWFVASSLVAMRMLWPKHAMFEVKCIFSPEFRAQPEYLALACLIMGKLAQGTEETRLYYNRALNMNHVPSYVTSVARRWLAQLTD